MHFVKARERLTARMCRPISKRAYVFIYGLIFVLMFAAFSFYLFLKRKGFIWDVDGISQQYPFFLLEGEWLRDLIKNIFVSHTMQVPQWSPMVGYGADYIVSLASNLGNPFNLISVFATPENGELLLFLTVFSELAVASILFTRYCLYHGHGLFPSTVGGFVYAFSGFSAVAFSQIFFIYFLAIAPLVLLGVDRIIDRKSPQTFIASIALCFIGSVTMAYQTCLLLFLYCLVRFFFAYDEKTPMGFARLFVRIFVPLCIGALIGMLLFLPTVMNIVHQGRLGVSRSFSLLYSPSYYKVLAESFVAVYYTGVDSLSGCLAISCMCVVTVFALRRFDHPTLGRDLVVVRVMGLAFLVMLATPIFGSLLNGMSYAANRWTWAVSLFLGYATALALPEMGRLTQVEWTRVGVIWFVYFVICSYSMLSVNVWRLDIAVVLLTPVAFVLYSRHGNRRLGQIATVLVMLASSAVLFGGWLHDSQASSMVGLGAAYDTAYARTPLSLLEQADVRTVGRYASRGYEEVRNANLVARLPGDTFYNSFYNNDIDEFHTSLGLRSEWVNYSYNGYDSRLGIEALVGVSHVIAPSSEQIGSHYQETGIEGEFNEGSYSLYSAQTPSLASLHSQVYARSLYDSLNMVQRQNLLLTGVVLEGGQGDATAPLDSLGVSDKRAFDLVSSVNAADTTASLDIDADGLTVHEPGSRLTLIADIPADMNAYLCLSGLNYDGGPARTGSASVTVSDGTGRDVSLTQGNENAAWYGGKHDWTINLGITSEDRAVITLTFSDAGRYDLRSLGLVFEDPVTTERLVSTFASRGVTDVDYDVDSPNRITGTVEVEDERGQVLLIRVPYAEGWHARVDGQKTDIQRADVGFMAVYLQRGKHEVSLEYHSPYLVPALTASAFGVMLAALYIKRCRKYVGAAVS